MTLRSLAGARIFDGTAFLDAEAVVLDGDRIAGTGAAAGAVTRLAGGVLLPGLIDLQVNGAGGIAVDGDVTADGLAAICAAQARRGATGCLPTLITDTPEATARVIAAGVAAARQEVPGFLGLHLEGPHLDPRRKGAHDPALIRPMAAADLERLCAAAAALPTLVVTLAPEAATAAQIGALAAAGAVVSLGHSDCTADAAAAAFAAGARMATHLFNAMSPLGSREPGLVGAVLGSEIPCGLIADGLHVDPLTLRVALAAKPAGVFLVSDCLALAGTDRREMTLNGRRILRRDGRLTLADGTLAGADLSLPQAIAVLTGRAGVAPERAFAMATSVPAAAIGRSDTLGRIAAGRRADLVHLDDVLALRAVWQGGRRLL
jgi:N-acetylglucosamine-6-phosphate deacetylase